MLQKIINKIDKNIQNYEKIVYGFLNKPQAIFDVIYKYILYVAWLIVVYEIFTHLYTFSRAIWIFGIITALYCYQKYKNIKSPHITTWIIFAKKIFSYIKSNREMLFGLGFVLYFFIFMVWFWFNTDDLLIQYSLFFFLIYIVYKLVGWKLDYEVRKQEFFSMTFAQILIIFSAVAYAALFRITDIFWIWVYKMQITLAVIIAGCVLLSYVFSNLFTTLASRRTKVKIKKYFYGLLLDNMRLILTGIIFLGVGLWILYNNGLLDFSKHYVFNGKSVEVVEEIEKEKQPELPRVEVPVETETFIIGDRYSFAGGIAQGSVNDEVLILKQYLRDLDYYSGDYDRVFNAELKQSLTDALIENCGWPETTRWILGPQAIDCIESLEITREVEQIEEVNPEKIQQIISNEA